jgi:hypothetical protein
MAKEEREEDRPLTPMSAMSMNWPTPVDFWKLRALRKFP